MKKTVSILTFFILAFSLFAAPEDELQIVDTLRADAMRQPPHSYHSWKMSMIQELPLPNAGNSLPFIDGMYRKRDTTSLEGFYVAFYAARKRMAAGINSNTVTIKVMTPYDFPAHTMVNGALDPALLPKWRDYSFFRDE
jgi:hypothetical protein